MEALYMKDERIVPQVIGSRDSLAKAVLVISLLITLLGAPSIPVTSREGGSLVAQRWGYCHFNQAVNASLDLNATIWFQYPFNDSYWWEHTGNLTWAFDPNLAFWAFVEADLPRISAAVAPNAPIEAFGWNTPFSTSNQASGFICNVENPGYRYGGNRWNCLYAVSWAYPFPETSEGPFQPDTNLRAFNYTLVAVEIPTLPMDQWTAEVWWNTTGLSDAQWTALADQLSARLNATWYMEACIIPKLQIEGNDTDTGTPWPFEMTLLGLLALLGLGRKRKRGT
jgi:MYXO-CTERM domain-containing protein